MTTLDALPAPPIVLGDRAKIRIIVLRLVENALKHTAKGGILVEWGETSVGAELREGEDPNIKREEDIRISVSMLVHGISPRLYGQSR